MTRKDYKLIAASIKRVVDIDKSNSFGIDANDALRNLVTELSTQLKLDNPNFKRDVFWKACGL